MRTSLAVIGVGNMAKAIISGLLEAVVANDLSNLNVHTLKIGDQVVSLGTLQNSDDKIYSFNKFSKIYLYDINKEQYLDMISDMVWDCDSLEEAITNADSVLISVKPQNYPEVLEAIKNVKGYKKKLYISIGAGISTYSIKLVLGNVSVLRALPNLPMVIGCGVTALCKNDTVSTEDFTFVKNIFLSSGGILEIDESEMNKIIGVTSSSPAYVFKFISAICEGARAQGIEKDNLLETVCDMVIGAAQMLKNSNVTPEDLISRVASKGGTTERALLTLNSHNFDNIIIEAMKACTERADELGSIK